MYWSSIVFTGKMLNSFNEHESFLLRSNSYKRVPQCCCLSASRQSSSPEMLTVRRLYLVSEYDMSFRGPQVCWLAEEPCTAALLRGHRNRLRLLAVSVLGGALLCLALFPSLNLWPTPQTDVHHSSSSKYLVSSPCVLLRWMELHLAVERLIWPGSADVTYKSAAGCESETHSRRVLLPCDLQANAGKSLFWQGSHLLPSAGQGLTVGCLWAKSQRI